MFILLLLQVNAWTLYKCLISHRRECVERSEKSWFVDDDDDGDDDDDDHFCFVEF